MTETSKAKAIIAGSYILYLIDFLLDKEGRNKGTTIRLKQALKKRTTDAANREYVDWSNEAWQMTIDQFKDKNMRLAIFDAVEMIGFLEEEAMKDMFGNNILDLISRFSYKHTYSGVSKEVLAESREVTKALIDNMIKVIFDNKK